MTDIRPDIPVSCATRPVVGGLVAPFVNLRMADGGVDFRSPHQARYEECWTKGLCQTCGSVIRGLAVLFGGPNQLRDRRFDEPPLCAPCALYASRACPMVAGRMDAYADRDRVSEGHRGETCPDPGCACGGFRLADPSQADHKGDPAHPWYALYVRPGMYQVTAHKTVIRCSDLGCEHERTLVNGCRLTAEPVKVILVSEPGAGRVWQKIDGGLAAIQEAS